MKKIVSFILLVVSLLVVPFAFTIASSVKIRSYLHKPAFNMSSNYKSNNFYTTYNNSDMIAKGYSVSQVKYAKVKENCYLFKTSDVTDSSYNNVWFFIPETYFVTILSEVDSMITRVQYKNKIGYVASDTIKQVDFVPLNPTLENVTFDITNDVGTQIRSCPNAENTSNILGVIPAGTTNLSYIATVLGDIPTGGTSNVWYYALYSPISDPTSVYEGYVYSEKTMNLTNYEANLEDVENAETPADDVTDFDEYKINGTIKTVLIILICVPIVLVFVLLVASNKRKRNENLEDDLNQGGLKSKSKLESKSLKAKDKDTITNYKQIQAGPHITNIDQLEGKSLTKKNKPYYAKFISTNTECLNDEAVPAFPTYEVIDDDDLLWCLPTAFSPLCLLIFSSAFFFLNNSISHGSFEPIWNLINSLFQFCFSKNMASFSTILFAVR